MEENYQIETKCIQSGWKPTKGEPRVTNNKKAKEA